MADNTDDREDDDREAETALADAVERYDEQNADADADENDDDNGDAEHLGDRGKRALDRMKHERKQLRDQLADVQGRLKEYEDANKTEAQRLSDDRDGHKTRAEKAEAELMRLRVGVRKGLTEAQARRLVGNTEDELEDDADDLLSSFAPKSTNDEQQRPERSPVPRRPAENLRGGGNPDEPPEESDPAKLAKSVGRR